MIEELIAYVIKDAFEGLSYSDPWSVELSIRRFFDQYQPERSKREDDLEKNKCSLHGTYYCGEKECYSRDDAVL